VGRRSCIFFPSLLPQLLLAGQQESSPQFAGQQEPPPRTSSSASSAALHSAESGLPGLGLTHAPLASSSFTAWRWFLCAAAMSGVQPVRERGGRARPQGRPGWWCTPARALCLLAAAPVKAKGHIPHSHSTHTHTPPATSSCSMSDPLLIRCSITCKPRQRACGWGQ